MVFLTREVVQTLLETQAGLLQEAVQEIEEAVRRLEGLWRAAKSLPREALKNFDREVVKPHSNFYNDVKKAAKKHVRRQFEGHAARLVLSKGKTWAAAPSESVGKPALQGADAEEKKQDLTTRWEEAAEEEKKCFRKYHEALAMNQFLTLLQFKMPISDADVVAWDWQREVQEIQQIQKLADEVFGKKSEGAKKWYHELGLSMFPRKRSVLTDEIFDRPPASSASKSSTASTSASSLQSDSSRSKKRGREDEDDKDERPRKKPKRPVGYFPLL